MHVGDSLESDVADASGIGAVSAWGNRDAKENDSGVGPDHEIRSLAECADLVTRNEKAFNQPDARDGR